MAKNWLWSTVPTTRLYPPKGAGKDAKLGWRIDFGSVARDDPDKLKVVLQINSNALYKRL